MSISKIEKALIECLTCGKMVGESQVDPPSNGGCLDFVLLFESMLSQLDANQCDQIGRFIGLWATF